MPESIGADPRQSRLLQSLNRFDRNERDALAVVGLALLDCINSARLVVNDDHFDNALAIATWRMVDTLYPLQDALHGPSGKLPAALAVFLATVEGVNHG